MKTSKQAGVSDSSKDTQMFLFFTLLFRPSARGIHAKDYLITGESEFFSLFFVRGKPNYIWFKLSLVFVRLLNTLCRDRRIPDVGMIDTSQFWSTFQPLPH